MDKKSLSFFLLLFASTLFSGEFPFYSAKKISVPPVIDGILNEECWKNAEMTVPFVAIGGKEVNVKTVGLLCWDKEKLYIGFICEEPLMEIIEKKIKDGNIKGFDESIEVFIDSRYDRSSYIQLRVGIIGERESRKGAEVSPEMQAGWTAGIKRDKDRWTVEMGVPFALIAYKDITPDTIWGLNLNRQRTVDPKGDAWTCWSDTKGPFATPSRFGNLIFTDYPVWARYYYTLIVNKLMDEVMELIMQYPQATKPFIPEMKKLDNLWWELIKKLYDEKSLNYKEISIAGDKVVSEYRAFLSQIHLAVIETEFR